MSVNGVSGANNASATTQLARVQPNGTIEITFGGKKTTVSKADSERFLETYNYVNYVAQRIAELEAAKVSGLDDDEVTELANLRSVLAKQREVTSFEVSPDGRSVVFTMKKNINAEEFKALFYIDDDGAFRDELKKEALSDGVWAEAHTYTNEGQPYSGYDDAWMAGVTSFENGVVLREEPDGHYYPDYTGATLTRGSSYSVGQSYIDPPNKPWYQWW